MSLRVRILLSIGFTIVALVVAITMISSRLTLRSFADLERKDMSESVSRAKRSVGQMVAEGHVKSSDWSSWDDAYRFMKDGNKDFVRSNMTDSALQRLHLDALLFATRQGRYFKGVTLPRSKGIPPPAAQTILSTLELRGERPVSGLIRLPGGTMMISARPVLTSEEKGPACGWVVFGRYFGAAEVAILRELTQLDVAVKDISDPAKAPRTSPEAKGAVAVITQKDRAIWGQTTLFDMGGRPLMRLSIQKPRAISSQGRQSVAVVRNLILGAGLVFGLVVLFVLERSALRRLSRLSVDVALVGQHRFVRVDGRDELSALGHKINEMLARLRESETRLQCYNADLERTVQERTREMEHQAFHDKLTGLANRALFIDRVGLALAKARRTSSGTATFFIDLDNFKIVNDSLGHGVGDELLVGVAERLRGTIRSGDTVARLGGDEFTVLLEDLTDVREAEEVAALILSALRAPFTLAGRELFAGGSVGIAYVDDETTVEEMMSKADIAMYRAKAEGKGSVVLYDESMNDHIAERMELETALRKALDHGEMRVYYQPLIDMATGRTKGAEALVRWMHPTRGMVSPDEFIPIAEEIGLIVPLGYWVLEEACRQAVAWLPDLPGFNMSVNLSGRQIQRDDLVARVAEILERTGLPPGNLKLEITETILMAGRDDVVEKLTRLKALGLRLALDDFGTGYSSLATLDALPIDTLKIDQSFVRRLGCGEEATSIVEAIMALSRGMNMDVTGEGVETDFQAHTMRRLGCHVGQGYLFDRPLAAEDFARRIIVAPLPMAA